MKPVLFASVKPLERAENIRAVYDAYDGEKAFVQTNGRREHPAIRSGRYDLMVIDEFPMESPGKIIMLLHGIAGGKTYGLDQPHPYYAAWQAPLIDAFVTTGTGTVRMMAKCANLPEDRVLPLGMPRTDGYIGKRKGDGGTVLANKRAYLYAPTFRSGGETPFPQIDWDWLDGELTDDELLVVKPHMATPRIDFGNRKHIVAASNAEPSAPYLMDCDVVITDYSTIMFDAYLLGKPVVLFEKAQGYTQTRGMYLMYPDEYCSRYCMDEGTLLQMIRGADGLTNTERNVIKYVADMCDGHSTERVVDLIHRIGGTA